MESLMGNAISSFTAKVLRTAPRIRISGTAYERVAPTIYALTAAIDAKDNFYVHPFHECLKICGHARGSASYERQ